jgi:hypothetical protein
VLAAFAAALLLAPTAPVLAASPGDYSAADQYVETLPTSRGPSATKESEQRGRSARLPERLRDKLHAQAGTDGASLEELATSGEFGAPQGTGGSADKDSKRSSSGSTPAVPTASVKAVRESGGDLLWLLLALLAITGLMVGAVAYQRHKNSQSG